MGCEVTVISTSTSKKDAAIKGLGAHHFLVSTDKEAMDAAGGSLDGIIDTVSAKHDLSDYVKLLDVFGKLVLVRSISRDSAGRRRTLRCIRGIFWAEGLQPAHALARMLSPSLFSGGDLPGAAPAQPHAPRLLQPGGHRLRHRRHQGDPGCAWMAAAAVTPSIIVSLARPLSARNTLLRPQRCSTSAGRRTSPPTLR